MFKGIKKAFSATADKISSGVAKLFNKKFLDASTIEELREVLITADIGVEKSEQIIQKIKKVDDKATIEDVKLLIRDEILQILNKNSKKIDVSEKPFVFLLCGINGNGKTTTIAKLANLYKSLGYKVRVGACDTFRAAAVEQLSTLCEFIDVPMTKGLPNADPASVAYRTVEEAVKNSEDIVLLDTAGRLHNREDLMLELEKISRVIKKIIPSIPNEILLVIDSTTGQTGLKQAETFLNKINITGIILTKIDGTAKGGIILRISEEYNLPVLFVCFGEKIDDIGNFDANEYANSIIDIN